MAQIQKGDTFVDGQQVTANRLNQLIDSATLLPNAITDQSSMPASSIQNADSFLIYSTANTGLRKVPATDVLQSNIPIKVSSITGGSKNDIVSEPLDGTAQTGKAYASVDGITNTVTSTAHGLVTGQTVLITSATNVSYNGTYRIVVPTGSLDTFTYTTSSVLGIMAGSGTGVFSGTLATVTSTAHGLTTGMLVKTTVTNNGVQVSGYSSASVTVTVTGVNTFTYSITTSVATGYQVVWQTLTPAPSTGTLTYLKKASNKTIGNIVATGNVYTDGSVIANNINVNGSITNNGVLNTGVVNASGFISTDGSIFSKTFQVLPRFDYIVQTRTQNTYTSGWGGFQNNTNLYGTNVVELNLQITPKKVGNTIILQWDVSGEMNYSGDTVWVVTRTPLSGTGANVAVALTNAVDDQNNTWSGVSAGNYDGNDASTLNKVTIKIADLSTLDVSCIYKLHFRSANNRTTTFCLNRTQSSSGALDYETGMSTAHAHEICV